MRFLTVILIISLVSGGGLVHKRSRIFPEKKIRPPESGKLQLHLVSHTHDDPGWRKTVDQYYMGSNSSDFGHYAVQYILDTVVAALLANPARRFVYCEQAFFQRWWRQQDENTRSAVQGLVHNGQLEFVNGGWAMHDEAATHYVAMIDQTTCGHKFLADQFGVAPRIGWQVDPFGHSATQAALLSAEVGFDALFFGRIDYQDRDARLAENRMEFIWSPSPSYGQDGAVFTGVFLDGNYGPPSGFCFDDIHCADPPIQDDPRLEDYNVADRVEAFVQQAYFYATYTEGNNIMMKMGSDMAYQNSRAWYKNLDKLIKYVNQDGRVNAFYSTPSHYYDAKMKEGINWTVKTDDFFPYADHTHAMWSGYFSSRAALKRNSRYHSHFLNAARHFEVYGGGDGSATQTLWEELGVAQHHDAVSGTEKQHVAEDYAKRIAKGYAQAAANMLDVLSSLLNKNSPEGPVVSLCALLNESTCDVSQNNEAFAMMIYNPRATDVAELISIPLNVTSGALYDSLGNLVVGQIVENIQTSIPYISPSPYSLLFYAQLAPLAYTTYFFQPIEATQGTTKVVFTPAKPVVIGSPPIVLENQYVQLTVSTSSATPQLLRDKVTGAVTPFTQDFYYYWSYVATPTEQGDESQQSGAYIFRPRGNATAINDMQRSLSVVSGPVVQEIHQNLESYITQTIRLGNNSDSLEMKWNVGTVYIKDGRGKEIISRFSTGIMNNAQYYMDSNGRELQRRIRDYRPSWNYTVYEPIAGNYYPVNALTLINDSTTQLTIVTDRSQGGASIIDGTVELMVQRRILHDDGRGVEEALNETLGITPYPDPVRIGQGIGISGTHYVQLSTPAAAARRYRATQARVFAPPIVSFTPITAGSISKFISQYNTQVNFGAGSLPYNVELMTFQSWNNGSVLVRVSHQYGVGEDSVYSNVTSFDLSDIFARPIISATELSLTANQIKANMKSRPQYTYQQKFDERVDGWAIRPGVRGEPTQITYKPDGSLAVRVSLGPLQIKTFQVEFT